jgi:hypothetical protein
MTKGLVLIWIDGEAEYFCEQGLDEPNRFDAMEEFLFWRIACAGTIIASIREPGSAP